MGFIAEERAFEVLRSLREPLARLFRFNRPLADQAKRAASSVALNIGEGGRRAGRDAIHSFRIAAGSAAELRNALRVAVALGELDDAELARSFELLDRQLRLLWGLTHPQRGSGARAARAPGR
jgi:four helix bundle protein